ncbi:hypothetical protein MHH52_10040 [Paenibacillus sp. FSL K6-0276]|uniref:hypothetical protein n=1 Tax=unclassified Paenibacillus TaxID=185978 RepID=UPI0028B02584|nr:hypothetical protein [Paenibacillus sp.]
MAIIKKPVNKKAVMATRALAAKRAKAAATRKKRRVRQTLDRFIVLAIGTNASGTPKATTGWTASLRTGTTTVTTDFDEFGVARFPTISTLTTVSYLLTLRDENGANIRSFTVPSDREFFVARF